MQQKDCCTSSKAALCPPPTTTTPPSPPPHPDEGSGCEDPGLEIEDARRDLAGRIVAHSHAATVPPLFSGCPLVHVINPSEEGETAVPPNPPPTPSPISLPLTPCGQSFSYQFPRLPGETAVVCNVNEAPFRLCRWFNLLLFVLLRSPCLGQ